MRRPWALPLVPLYWAGLKANQAFTRERRLRLPVVSVGSLSAGGAGKTPAVKMLAELLRRQGVEVDVLSRGYGRRARGVERVRAEGDAWQFGDEPLEMARAGLAVFVGADRFAAGQLAEADGVPRIHLLDDGFQHGRLARGLNVVLVTLADVKEWLLPAGNLREPLSALRRADVLVIREEELAEIEGRGRWCQDRECWVIRRRLSLPDGVPERVVAFCGLARPEGFFGMLGTGAVGLQPFLDHHTYTEADVEDLLATARRCGAAGFVTTGKDAVKLSEAMRLRLGAAGPVCVAELRVELVNERAALARLEPLIRRLPR